MKKIFIVLISLLTLCSCSYINKTDSKDLDSETKKVLSKVQKFTKDKVDNLSKDIEELKFKPQRKTDDMNQIVKNIQKLSKKDDRASYLLSNWENLTDIEKYLVGNDPDTLEFVYNVNADNTDFDYYIGVSKDYGRETPYYLQWDNRWAYSPLSDSNIGYAGCGPTSMAMIISRLTQDKTIDPLKIAEDAQSYMNDNGIKWEFFQHEANRYGFDIKEIEKNEKKMKKALSQGPLLVSVDRGYFTLFGHILVIDSVDDGKFVINDPNSLKNSQRKWSYSEIEDQIVKIWQVY